MPVTLSPQINDVEEGEVKLELSFPQGEQLKLSGKITPTLLAILIKEMRA
ncbi:MAG: hypothetical protein HRU40_19285 [Saprospiraceae bacterium]|nr:hypothetical protein [Saprospiraceae bacterium]